MIDKLMEEEKQEALLASFENKRTKRKQLMKT